MRRRLEKSIEKACKRWATNDDWWWAKFKSPGKRSAPDDVFIKYGRHVFVEFKAEGEEATENQTIYHEEMRKAGAEVYVTDNVEDFKTLFRRIDAEIAHLAWLYDDTPSNSAGGGAVGHQHREGNRIRKSVSNRSRRHA